MVWSQNVFDTVINEASDDRTWVGQV